MTMVEYDGPITGADLHALIERNAVLRGNYAVPSSAALDALATAISVIRGRCSIGRREGWTPEQIASDNLRRRASDALQTLAEVLPAIRAERLAQPHLAPFDALTAMELSQIKALEAVVKKAWEYSWLTPHEELAIQVVVGETWAMEFSDAYAISPPAPDRELSRWHHFGAWLADVFRDVVQASNPRLPRLGNSNDGPVVRFLACIIPRITGEQPTPAAVRRWLQRQSEWGRNPI